jgi:hypothetical protein
MWNNFTNLSDRAVMAILVGAAVLTGGLSFLVNAIRQPNVFDWIESWLQNFSTELFGAFVTFILLELVVGIRRARETETKQELEFKARTIRQMRSPDNGLAMQAIEELRAHQIHSKVYGGSQEPISGHSLLITYL